MKKLLTTLAIVAFLAASAHAQQIQLNVGDVDVKSIDYDTQKTPEFQAGGVNTKKVPNPRDWLEVEVEFKVAGRDDVVVPELLFRYYIGFTDQNGQGRTLTGDVKHINVVPGEDYFSAVYVAPSTLGELTGDFRRFQPRSVQAVGLEVLYNGVVVGGKSSRSGSSAKFWQATGTQPGILAKQDTPFALLWIDRYAEVERTQ
ncbi:MAG: Amuc_1102 family pilus-like protein [Verrucomicrobiales bacterium]